ncbi:MAG: tail fiber domain-containing protein [Cloacibacterium sp.]|nr:tail fiber domain-containing protein [Cloacibacterium sp.]
MKTNFLLFFMFVGFLGFSQNTDNIGIGTTDPNISAKLDITATDKGILIPRVALTGDKDVTTIPSPAVGLMIYNTATAGTIPEPPTNPKDELPTDIPEPDNVVPGFYFWSGSRWENLSGRDWSLAGNLGTNPKNHFIGTKDKRNLNFKINNVLSGKLTTVRTDVNGNAILSGIDDGNGPGFNVAVFGYGIMQNIDQEALPFGTTAIGALALHDSDDSAVYNTAIGGSALFKNTSGIFNTAVGYESLARNTTGYFNTAIGSFSLSSYPQSSGKYNIGIGSYAQVPNKDANNQLSIGNSIYALNINNSGSVIVANDYNDDLIGIATPTPTNTLDVNGTARVRILDPSTEAADKFVVADANGVLKTKDASALPANNIYTSDGTISANRIVTVADTGSLVFQKPAGSTTTNEVVNVLGTVKTTAIDLNSDQRLKENIKTLDSTTSTLSALRPVSYHWNKKGKAKGGDDKLQYGFIAQEVEKVLPHLVNTDKEGYKSVNYIEVIPVLTKALQEEKLRNDSQEAKLNAQQKEIDELKKLVEKLTK